MNLLGMLGFLSPRKDQGNQAPVEPDTSSDDYEEPAAVVSDEDNDADKWTPIKKTAAATRKKRGGAKAKAKPAAVAVAKRGGARRNARARKTTVHPSKKAALKSKPAAAKRKATAKHATPAKKHAKVKSEPVWERRSRRKTRGYKKGSLSESAIMNKAWKGSGTRADPLIVD